MTPPSLFAAVIAHPGHGATPHDSWLHYLTEPAHVGLVGLVTGIGVVLTARWWRDRQRRRF